MIKVNLVAADISKKSGILLDKFERQQATHEILALANLSDIDLIQNDLNIGDFPLLSLRCISSVLKVSSNKAKHDNEKANPEYSLKRVGITPITCDEINLFITGISLIDGKFSSAWINSVSRFLGGCDFAEYDLPLLNEHKSSCLAAYRILESAGVGIEIIQRNSGVLIPFPCKSPESGSGTSRALPGVLMLPTGVPDLMYAECWLHECLHTELLLAEWATGEELAKCDQNLVTPWRTVNRSANLLLHGCFVFVHLGAKPPPLSKTLGEAPQKFRNYNFSDLRIGKRIVTEVRANWKLVAENFSECFHCPPVHPEFCRVVPSYREAGAWGLRDEAETLPEYKAGATTLTLDGSARIPPFRGLEDTERQSLYVPWLAPPNLFLNVQPDYVNAHMMFPTGPETVRIIYDWLFEPEHMPKGVDLDHYVGLWDITNQQDARNCEWQQQGMRSRRFKHGVFVPQEFDCHRFCQWVRAGVRAGLRGKRSTAKRG